MKKSLIKSLKKIVVALGGESKSKNLTTVVEEIATNIKPAETPVIPDNFLIAYFQIENDELICTLTPDEIIESTVPVFGIFTDDSVKKYFLLQETNVETKEVKFEHLWDGKEQSIHYNPEEQKWKEIEE